MFSFGLYVCVKAVIWSEVMPPTLGRLVLTQSQSDSIFTMERIGVLSFCCLSFLEWACSVITVVKKSGQFVHKLIVETLICRFIFVVKRLRLTLCAVY